MRMAIRAERVLVGAVAVLAAVATGAAAHDIHVGGPVVIDTDLGLDDAVALAVALQAPDLEIEAVVATEGVASARKAALFAQQLLATFNRSDIALYAAATTPAGAEAPVFRAFAEEALAGALPEMLRGQQQPFSPDAYRSARGPVCVVALGPLTNLAAALQQDPSVAKAIGAVVIPETGAAGEPFNRRYDREAWDIVQRAQLPVVFVQPGGHGTKSEAWRTGQVPGGMNTSIGETFVERLLSGAEVGEHYAQQRRLFGDELAVLYLVAPKLFAIGDHGHVAMPSDEAAINQAWAAALVAGRQIRPRTVFAVDRLPREVFRADLQSVRERVIADHGEAEWRSQWLLHELHGHVGVYSVVGVKMGLRAAELLNAPLHEMRVASHAPAGPPVSCFNDGLIVATGSTPGRGLFTHMPLPGGGVRANFMYNGRNVALRLKPEYQQQIARELGALRAKHSLESPAYWSGVRALSLRLCAEWHRRDLFQVADAGETPPE